MYRVITMGASHRTRMMSAAHHMLCIHFAKPHNIAGIDSENSMAILYSQYFHIPSLWHSSKLSTHFLPCGYHSYRQALIPFSIYTVHCIQSTAHSYMPLAPLACLGSPPSAVSICLVQYIPILNVQDLSIRHIYKGLYIQLYMYTARGQDYRKRMHPSIIPSSNRTEQLSFTHHIETNCPSPL